MEQCVLGIDLGTSAVKVSAVNKNGCIIAQESHDISLRHAQSGYSEQNPEGWVQATIQAISTLINNDLIDVKKIAGISFAGQMHGLVLLGANNEVLRPAILWDDTRTTKQCEEINDKMGNDFISITYNKPLEGFTLPKILWVQENEPDIWAQAKKFVLPKDYLRYRMTGNIMTDFSDATGTVMLSAQDQQWSEKICSKFNIPLSMCPEIVKSTDFTGYITDEFADISGLTTATKTYAGIADNAGGAIGAGILNSSLVLSSVGTSGVVLKYEPKKVNYNGVLQFEDHGIPGSYYSMGVTLAAGDSLNWFKKIFYPNVSFEKMVNDAQKSVVGAHGLLFTPYLVGERAPYADSKVRGSFIGLDSTHKKNDFVRAVMEGIIFSFKDIMDIYEKQGNNFDTVVSIGGGSKSSLWLQIQADIFNKKVVRLQNEQGPGMGAAMVAAVGLKWFKNFEECTDEFVTFGNEYQPIVKNVQKYYELHQIYKKVYRSTREISHELLELRNKF